MSMFCTRPKRAELALSYLVGFILTIVILVMMVYYGSQLLQAPTNMVVAEHDGESIKGFVDYFSEGSDKYSSMTECYSSLRLENLENFQVEEEDGNFFLVIDSRYVYIVKKDDDAVDESIKNWRKYIKERVPLGKEFNIAFDETDPGFFTSIDIDLLGGYSFGLLEARIGDYDNAMKLSFPEDINIILMPNFDYVTEGFTFTNAYRIGILRGFESDYELEWSDSPEARLIFVKRYKEREDVIFIPSNSVSNTIADVYSCSTKLVNMRYNNEFYTKRPDKINFVSNDVNFRCRVSPGEYHRVEFKWKDGPLCYDDAKLKDCKTILGNSYDGYPAFSTAVKSYYSEEVSPSCMEISLDQKDIEDIDGSTVKFDDVFKEISHIKTLRGDRLLGEDLRKSLFEYDTLSSEKQAALPYLEIEESEHNSCENRLAAIGEESELYFCIQHPVSGKTSFYTFNERMIEKSVFGGVESYYFLGKQIPPDDIEPISADNPSESAASICSEQEYDGFSLQSFSKMMCHVTFGGFGDADNRNIIKVRLEGIEGDTYDVYLTPVQNFLVENRPSPFLSHHEVLGSEIRVKLDGDKIQTPEGSEILRLSASYSSCDKEYCRQVISKEGYLYMFEREGGSSAVYGRINPEIFSTLSFNAPQEIAGAIKPDYDARVKVRVKNKDYFLTRQSQNFYVLELEKVVADDEVREVKYYLSPENVYELLERDFETSQIDAFFTRGDCAEGSCILKPKDGFYPLLKKIPMKDRSGETYAKYSNLNTLGEFKSRITVEGDEDAFSKGIKEYYILFLNGNKFDIFWKEQQNREISSEIEIVEKSENGPVRHTLILDYEDIEKIETIDLGGETQ